jgi:hypothetical protein
MSSRHFQVSGTENREELRPAIYARLAKLGGGFRCWVLYLLQISHPYATDLRDLLAQSIIEIRTGKLDSKLANSISYLGTGSARS